MKIGAVATLALCVAVLAAPALGDSKMTVAGGVLYFRSEDAGVGNRLTIDLDGRGRVHFVDEADPYGISFPTPPCSPGRVNSNGYPVEVFCERSGYNRITVQTGPGEDQVVSKLDDITLTLEGGVGTDQLTSAGGADILVGGQGDDTLRSGEGNDRLDGGEGADTIDGAGGDDSVIAADGLVDTVDCGAGNDAATVDTGDKVANCETVTSRGSAAAPTGPDKTRPRVEVGGSTSQRIARSRRITLAATVSEPAQLDASGFISAGGFNSRLAAVSRKVRVGGGGVTVRLVLSRATVKRVLADLRRGRRPYAQLTVSAADVAGNTSRARHLRIRLRR